MPSEDIDLMIILEGMEHSAYLDTRGNNTVGIGFNMDRTGAKKTWERLQIREDFDLVYTKKMTLSLSSINMLFSDVFATCQHSASRRCDELGLNYSAMADYKRFLLADIVYNVGNVSKWTKVFMSANINTVIFEGRRRPYEMLDSRVAKIAYHYSIINSVEQAHKLGLVHTKYIV